MTDLARSSSEVRIKLKGKIVDVEHYYAVDSNSFTVYAQSRSFGLLDLETFTKSHDFSRLKLWDTILQCHLASVICKH